MLVGCNDADVYVLRHALFHDKIGAFNELLSRLSKVLKLKNITTLSARTLYCLDCPDGMLLPRDVRDTFSIISPASRTTYPQYLLDPA